MRFAVLADLHISNYGDTNEPRFVQRRPILKVGGAVRDMGIFWTTHSTTCGWKIQQNRISRHWRILDPAGNRRATLAATPDALAGEVERFMAADAGELNYDDRVERLVGRPPDAALMNTNLNLLVVRRRLEELKPVPEYLIFPGDLTDNGLGKGFELIRRVFDRWFEARRVFIVPGNHDLNKVMIRPLGIQIEMEPETTRREDKEARFWRWYSEVTGLGRFNRGCSDLVWANEDIALVGLDSVADVRRVVAFEASLNAVGRVSSEALDRLSSLASIARSKNSSCRLVVVLHHHVLWKGLAVSGLDEPFMALRNAKEVWARFKEAKIDLVLNGHRHHSYHEKDLGPGCPTLVSSPSATLGDARPNEEPFFWIIDIEKGSGIVPTPVPLW